MQSVMTIESPKYADPLLYVRTPDEEEEEKEKENEGTEKESDV